jgi:hypothetical protein
MAVAVAMTMAVVLVVWRRPISGDGERSSN